MKIIKKIKKANAISWIDDEKLIIFVRGHFLQFNVDTNKKELIARVPMTLKQFIFSLSSLGRRLFRLYPYSPVLKKDTNELFFSFCGFIYCLELKTGVLRKEFKLKHKASRVLSICICSDGDVYYGEYPTRYDKEPICIYKRNNRKEWCLVYDFISNSIRHIHLLKEYNNDLYCFTGDENDQVNIFCFNGKNFNNAPSIIASGEQKFRTCVAKFHNNCLYYLTDNPYHQNKVYSIDLKTKQLKEIGLIEGSVIYGCESSEKLYFSTSVEKNLSKDENGNNVALKIDGVSGGIRSKSAIIYCFDETELKQVFSLKKDFLPIKYFGLGSFIFTSNYSNRFLASTSVSLRQCETTFIFSLHKEDKRNGNTD